MSKYSFILNPLFFLIPILVCQSFLVHSKEDTWVVNDIRISGLQRVSAGSVFAEMPLSDGDLSLIHI